MVDGPTLDTQVAVIASEVANMNKNMTDFKDETRAAHVRLESAIAGLDVIGRREFENALADAHKVHDQIVARLDSIESKTTNSWLKMSGWAITFLLTGIGMYVLGHLAK